MPRLGQYGVWGKPLRMNDLYEAFNRSPKVAEALAEQQGVDAGELLEGTGAPEGRADFPTFLLAVSRHKMREAFKRREAVWERYVGVARAEDFREHTTSEMGSLSGMGPVDERNAYPRVRSTEAGGPSYAVGKHGGIYGITFELVINDETDRILNSIPRELGRMSAAYVSRIIVALVESNPTYSVDGVAFFHSSRGNVYTGSAADPTETNILTMLTNMENQRDSEGFPLEISANRILTQNQLTASIFRRMIRADQTAMVIDAGSLGPRDQARTAGNALKGVLPDDAVIVEPYLNDPNDYTILAGGDRPAFLAAFLRGQREPFIGIEESNVRAVNGGGRDLYSIDFDVISYKVRHVFGVQAWEPRSAAKAIDT